MVKFEQLEFDFHFMWSLNTRLTPNGKSIFGIFGDTPIISISKEKRSESLEETKKNDAFHRKFHEKFHTHNMNTLLNAMYSFN